MCYHGTLVSLIFLKKKMKMKRKERVEKDKRDRVDGLRDTLT